MIFYRSVLLTYFVVLMFYPLTIAHHPIKHKVFNQHKLVQYISNKYKVSTKNVEEIIILANKHGTKEFPQPHDILAIIAIESSFKPYAVSKAKAKGLMQILYKKTSFDPKLNIPDGAALLEEYHTRLKSVDSAVQSYNVGIGNFKKGMRNYKYLNKFKQEKENIINADIL